MYRDNEETLLTITPQNHEPFTEGEYRWILANQPPINVLLNMLGRAEYQYSGLIYSDYSKCSVEYGRNTIKIHIPTPFLYHKKAEYIRFTSFIYDRAEYDGQGQYIGTYQY